MAVNLSNLKPARDRGCKVRVGRGIAQNLAGRPAKANKGQKSRKGYSRRPGFEGGQIRCGRRIQSAASQSYPRRVCVVNVEMLNAFPAGRPVTPELLIAKRPDSPGARRNQGFWAMGELTAAITVRRIRSASRPRKDYSRRR